MQPLYATVLEIRDATPDTFADVAVRAINWASRGAIEDQPDLSPGLHVIEAPHRQIIRYEVHTGEDAPERGFELTWTHPDRSQESLIWQNRVEAVLTGDVCHATVRIARESTAFVITPAPVTLLRPALVPQLLRVHRCFLGGIPAEPEGRILRVGDVDEWLDRVLRNPDRNIPVILLAGPRSKSPEQASADLADALVGIAAVFALGTRLAWERVRDELGFLATPPFGGARFYWPGFGQRSALRHKWYTASQVNDWSDFRHRLFRTLSRLSTVRVPRSAVLERLARAERDRRLQQLQQRADPEVIALYEHELVQLEDRVKELEADVDRQSQVIENQDAELLHWRTGGRADALATPEEELVDEAEQLDSAIDAVIELASEVADWSEVKDFAEQLESESLRFTGTAREHLGSNSYVNPGRMLLHLARLARSALEYHRLEGRIGDRLQDWAIAFDLDLALHDHGRQSTSFEYEGEHYDNGPHVKIDDNKPRNECGRIYFALDPERGRFIVNYVGAHP